MSPRKPNMLEAFQRSAQVDKTRRDAENSRPETPGSSSPEQADPTPQVGVGGPFDALDGTPDPKSAAASPGPGFGVGDDVLGTAPRSSSGFSARTALLAVAILIAMVVVFQLGRDLGNSTEAAGPGDDVEVPESGEGAPLGNTDENADSIADQQPSTPSEPATSEGSEDGLSMTKDDRAFLDAANNWTVIAISFDHNAKGGKLALETYKHLREQGFPAIAPVTRGGYLLICVGAEPNRNQAIEQLRSDLKRLQGPPPQNQKEAYSTAYFANIEDLIDPQLRR